MLPLLDKQSERKIFFSEKICVGACSGACFYFLLKSCENIVPKQLVGAGKIKTFVMVILAPL
jgi:hypothetical protein